MKLIIEIAVMTNSDAELGHIHTLPFEYESVVKLENILKLSTEKLIKMNGHATATDYYFKHEGYEIDLRKLVFDGKYEPPGVMTVHEYFKSHNKSTK
jgi:hypothetical protein